MDLMLAGKVAVVTGASKGIGMSVTQTLAEEGAFVVAAARNISSLQGLDNVTAVSLDLSDPTGPGLLVDRALEDYGRVDVLVNNMGGVKLRLNGFLETTDADFQWAFDQNFFTTLRASRSALVAMVQQKGGSIVNVASVNAMFQPDGATVDYGAAKAAVANLTKAMAEEFGSQGIRVNAVSPGPVSTDLWLGEDGVAATVGKAMGVDADSAREAIVAGMGGIATGRFTTPEEVGTLIAVLASPRSSNITGVNYVIDGGLIKST